LTAPLLEVQHLRFAYGTGPSSALAIDDVSFALAAGDFVSIVGPSGSGKTTLLRCISGLHPPSAGEVRLHGDIVSAVPTELAIVFQDYGRSLFPWLSVHDNVDMPLRRLGLNQDERASRISSALTEVGLAEAARKYPWQLSGGMQQRVAIARAIAYRPSILLMDEPFASVDAQTRSDLQDTTLDIWRAHGSTVLFVTHDIDEAVYLSDRVVVLSQPPARVEAEIAIDLPRPRDQIETPSSSRFVDLRHEVARLIRRPRRGLTPAPKEANVAAGSDRAVGRSGSGADTRI
jgi:NitT/TauT family transport system ATP-binding protein